MYHDYNTLSNSFSSEDERQYMQPRHFNFLHGNFISVMKGTEGKAQSKSISSCVQEMFRYCTKGLGLVKKYWW